MSRRSMVLTPDLMLRAYRAGLFPMAETRHGNSLYWLDPDERGILPLDGFHLARRLRRTVLSGRFTISADLAFPNTIAGCAQAGPGREDTWINRDIQSLFIALHDQGHAHSIECWHEGKLVGGLYGVAIGAAFFGESMFSTETDASKVALVHLVARLRRGGFALLDTQFVTGHLARFGAVEIPRERYKALLSDAVSRRAVWEPRLDEQALRDEISAWRASGAAA